MSSAAPATTIVSSTKTIASHFPRDADPALVEPPMRAGALSALSAILVEQGHITFERCLVDGKRAIRASITVPDRSAVFSDGVAGE